MEKSLSAIRGVIPQRCLKPHNGRAILYIGTGVAFFTLANILAIAVWHFKLYYLYPVSWFIGATSFTSLFVLGHDCGHYSMLKSKKLMNVLGHIFFLPVCYPFFAWKYSHDAHHKYTNLLKRTDDIYFDNAWIPETKEDYSAEKKTRPFMAFLYRIARMFPPVGSWMHHGYYLVASVGRFREDHRKKVILSLVVLAASILVIAPIIVYFSGSAFGLFYFWILPGVAFQFWMSVYTFLHHTGDGLKFYEEGEWTPYRAQVESTVNVLWPKWISYLHGNIDIHLPHHVAATIPAYWLREANEAIKSSAYREDVRELKFSPGYLFKQLKACRLWDTAEKRYATFSEIS